MRIVLDTNVLVSAFISKRGQPARLLDLLLTFPEIQLVVSDPILEELGDVLSREEVRQRFHYSIRDIKSFVRAVRNVSVRVKIKSDFDVVAEDPKDNVILNTAYDARADYVVSGDRHLQKLRRFKGVRVVNPNQMMKVLIKKFGEFIIPKPRK
jgi:hypothetical protein